MNAAGHGSVSAAAVATRAEAVRERITAAGGDPDTVTVLAVTKGFGPDAVEAATGAGLVQLGENYAQELRAKADATMSSDRGDTAAITWHFIGRLQSNKVRQLTDLVDVWQSVDRASLVRELSRRAPHARVMVQVNAAGEDHKGGCPLAEVADLVASATDAGLIVEGLMTVGVADDERATRDAFARVRSMVDELGLPQCSMGMTADLEWAVEAGTTMVRVGTALFGARST